MDRDTLRELLAKVEAGETLRSSAFNPMKDDPDCRGWARMAHNGSLDAAKELHEALLPGWTVRLCAFTVHGNSSPHVHVFRMRLTESDPTRGANSSGYEGDDPARAWLCAILSALIAEGE